MQVHLNFFNVSPVALLAVVCMFSIIGNALVAFSYISTTGIKYTAYLWSASACTATSCVLVEHADLGKVPGCDFHRQYQASQALGILTSIASGIATIVALVVLLRQEALGMARVASYGVTMGALLAVLEGIEFVVFVTIRTRMCVSSSTVNIALGPAPFMYLAGFLLSMVVALWSHAFVRRSVTQQQPPTSLQAQPQQSAVVRVDMPSTVASQQQQLPFAEPLPLTPISAPEPLRGTAPAEVVVRGSSPPLVTARAMAPIATTATSVPPEPSAPTPAAFAPTAATTTPSVGTRSAVREQSGGGEDVTSTPGPARRFPQLDPASTLENPLPMGNDWAYDSTTQLMWSDTEHLFFDPNSAQFYDPVTELWFDPEQQRWHRITS